MSIVDVSNKEIRKFKEGFLKNIIHSFRDQMSNEIFYIPKDFIYFKEYTKWPEVGMFNHHCYSNSIGFTKYKIDKQKQIKGIDLCIGFVVHPVLVYQLAIGKIQPSKIKLSGHAWNLKNGKIVDITWGSDHGSARCYFGKILEHKIYDNFNGYDLRVYLWSLLGLKPEQYWDNKSGFPQNYDDT